MPHKGEILESIARKKSRSIAALADAMGVDRGTIYRHFKEPDLSDAVILKYAKVLKYDFRNEFPDLGGYGNMLQEPVTEYRPLSLTEALKEVDYWKGKYIDLLERHNELLNSRLEGLQRA